MLERITDEIGVEREREAGRIKEACGKGGTRCGNGRGRIAFPTGGARRGKDPEWGMGRTEPGGLTG
jgi:hypothetical protein